MNTPDDVIIILWAISLETFVVAVVVFSLALLAITASRRRFRATPTL
jgi:hypothetical protein